ncbi:AfsR/SARP family transcriptional regulator [Sphaerisporangium perillae]|uniref:AfsR/SARP family transcriptional regulator n=1 Tax=Sphaerisporangium perillae TaxID=2935860 RepID=UPI00200F20FC|nr:AfsR/SARP family transcriptional regulator [Sphaerisporangium perillae]
MRFRCLGPLEVWDGERWVPPSGRKVRGVLAALLVRAGQNVSTDYLVQELWGEAPPSSCRTLVRGYVLSLRRLLNDRDADVLRYRDGGYRLNVERDAVDAACFEDLCDEAGRLRARGDPAGAAKPVRRALSLWRGPVMADVPVTSSLATYADVLGERRLAALEWRMEADLEEGRAEDLVKELVSLVAEHPFREGFAVLLMRAMHLSGRRSEALKFFADHRRRLRDDLGVGPGPELGRVHQEVLVDERRPAAPNQRQGPVQTPPCLADFTGRQKEIEHWTAVLAADGPRALRTVAISGRAGVGKTTLAVHLAHGLREGYPDGQLCADFTGQTAPAAVLGQFLRALGVPGPSVPETLPERVQLYRSLLADRRVLVLVDNADAEAQVRALQPGSAGCAVVVTSRKRLLGLESASFVDLDVLEPGAALDLFAKIVTAGRVEQEPESALEIVELCGRLPLAVRIAGARVTARPGWRLSAFAAELRDEASRLDRLRAGDLDVKAAIGTSYAGLDEPQRRLFRLLGLLDAPDFPGWAAAALTGTSERVADEWLFGLVDARLVDEIGPDLAGRARFRLHELIRIFARHRAETEDDAAGGREALCRAFGGWLLLAEEADARLPARTLAALHPSASRWRPDAAESMVSDPFAWFETERRTIIASVRQAAGLGATEYAWGLAAAAQTFYELRDAPEGTRTHQVALAACREAGDRLGEAIMLRNLADLHSGKSGTALDDKLESTGSSCRIFRELGERRGLADALYLCGDAHRLRGDHDQALTRLHESLEIARSCDYLLGELHVLQQFGIIDNERGRLDEALEHARRAMVIAEKLAGPREECVVRTLLGVIHKRAGRYDEGAEQLREAVAKARSSADPLLEAQVLAHLGQLYADHGHPDARRTLERGLAAGSACHYDFGQAVALHGLGLLESAEGRHEQAIARFRAAAVLWERLQHAYGRARTMGALGEVYAKAGDRAAARLSLAEARRQYLELGNETEAARLTALTPEE